MRSLSQLENRLQTDSVQPGSPGPRRPRRWCLGAPRTLAGRRPPSASVANEDRVWILPGGERERGSELSIDTLGTKCKWEKTQRHHNDYSKCRKILHFIVISPTTSGFAAVVFSVHSLIPITTPNQNRCYVEMCFLLIPSLACHFIYTFNWILIVQTT